MTDQTARNAYIAALEAAVLHAEHLLADLTKPGDPRPVFVAADAVREMRKPYTGPVLTAEQKKEAWAGVIEQVIDMDAGDVAKLLTEGWDDGTWYAEWSYMRELEAEDEAAE